MTRFEEIREWATSKGIYEKGDLKTQFLKLSEEVGELGKAILKQDEAEFIDAIGDCVIVLTNLCELGNNVFGKTYFEDVAGDGGSKMEMFEPSENTIEDCINSAYEVIKNRTGKMENGTFVKAKEAKGEIMRLVSVGEMKHRAYEECQDLRFAGKNGKERIFWLKPRLGVFQFQLGATYHNIHVLADSSIDYSKGLPEVYETVRG